MSKVLTLACIVAQVAAFSGGNSAKGANATAATGAKSAPAVKGAKSAPAAPATTMAAAAPATTMMAAEPMPAGDSFRSSGSVRGGGGSYGGGGGNPMCPPDAGYGIYQGNYCLYGDIWNCNYPNSPATNKVQNCNNGCVTAPPGSPDNCRSGYNPTPRPYSPTPRPYNPTPRPQSCSYFNNCYDCVRPGSSCTWRFPGFSHSGQCMSTDATCDVDTNNAYGSAVRGGGGSQEAVTCAKNQGACSASHGGKRSIGRGGQCFPTDNCKDGCYCDYRWGNSGECVGNCAF